MFYNSVIFCEIQYVPCIPDGPSSDPLPVMPCTCAVYVILESKATTIILLSLVVLEMLLRPNSMMIK